MNLRDLFYVIALAEHKNFTRAAKVANVSQPALSNQIKKLEAELGVEIFNRGKNEVGLTEFGEEFLAIAKQVNGLIKDANDLAQKYSKTEIATFRLGMTPTLAAYLSKYFRDLFKTLYPSLKLIIVEEYPVSLSKMIEDKTVDAALIAYKSYESLTDGFRNIARFRSLWFEPVYLAVSKGHSLTERPSLWAKEIPADLLIRFPVSFGYALENELPEPSKDASDLMGIDVKTARFETVCRYVAQSDACTMVNAIAAMQFKKDGFGLDFIPFKDEGNKRELGALTREEYPRMEIIEAMFDYIQKAPPAGTLAVKPT